jgi:pimeloyl-ACP methyl ester carboxylesterase
MHYVDEGPVDGEVVLMLHGQPSWSYLYRKMIPVLVEAGYRVIAADHIGMGRSDKPVDPRVHEFESHVRWMKLLIEELGLSDITLFVQDWGSHVGLRIAGDQPELFARIVVANGDLIVIPPGLNPFTSPVFEFDQTVPPTLKFFTSRSREPISAFQEWIEFAAQASHLFAADVVELGTGNELTETEFAAYNAPYPSQLYWGGIRAFPSMVAGITDQNAPAFEELGRFDRPFLFLAGENDPSAGSVANQNKWIAHVPGATGQDHRRYAAGHFIQEDVGQEIATQVVEFMQNNPIPVGGPLFNLRYCELLLVQESSEISEAQIYTTLGLSDCPQPEWDALDLEAIATEQEALLAAKNGPRFWTLDLIELIDNEGTTPIPGFGEIATFGELDMRLVGAVEFASGISEESQPYVVSEVQRDTIFVFVAGRRIFELEDPDGGIYVMQSMTQMTDPELQLYDLISLGDDLDLPSGWTFSTRVLKEELRLVANGIARIVTDDLSNTYQKVE